MDFQVPSHILPHLYVFYVDRNITAAERVVCNIELSIDTSISLLVMKSPLFE